MTKRVLEPKAIGDKDGFPIVILPEYIYEDDDPLVKARPDLFVEAWVPATMHSASPPRVEQATAAPGEKRAVVRK